MDWIGYIKKNTPNNYNYSTIARTHFKSRIQHDVSSGGIKHWPTRHHSRAQTRPPNIAKMAGQQSIPCSPALFSSYKTRARFFSVSLIVIMHPRYRKFITFSIGWSHIWKVRRSARMHWSSCIFRLFYCAPSLQSADSGCVLASADSVQNMPQFSHRGNWPSSKIIIVSK
jgi:hypothetical protein